MRREQLIAVLWLLAGLAFVVAGLLADRRQTAWFAVATLFFAVSVITARRGGRDRRSVRQFAGPDGPTA